MTRTHLAVGLALALLTGAGLASAGAFSDAERAVAKFDDAANDLKSLSIAEAEKIVTAICEAKEDDRKKVARDISNRVKSRVKSEYQGLEKLAEDAEDKLDEVLDDGSLKRSHSKAKSLKKKVKKRWDTVERMTKSLRGANHPVVSWMLDKGNEAHASRQRGSNCDVVEFSMRSGRADCLKARGKTCDVIELKPKNSKAIRNGRAQARRYADELNKKGSAFDKLVKKESDFAKCERFEAQVDCYILCPDIDGDGEFRSTSPSWSTDC
ncbi:MAG: hypothetical protein AAGC55_07905 [Myxococcota bacterium]